MPPVKRARPSFSPPRAGKSKSIATSASHSTTKNAAIARKRAPEGSKRSTNPKDKYMGRKGTRAALLDSDGEDDEQDEDMNGDDDDDDDEDVSTSRSKAAKAKTKARSKNAFVDDEASDNDDNDEEAEDDEENGQTITSNRRQTNHSRSTKITFSSSPEPDMILAEVTHNNPSTQPPIPEPLVAKILQSHFEKPETKIKVDARDLVARYIEIFVKEAVARSVYEKQSRDKDAGRGGGGGDLVVADLERAAVQLCLDF